MITFIFCNLGGSGSMNLRKASILLLSIIGLVIVISTGYVEINTKKIYTAVEKYLIQNRGYTKGEIRSIEVKHSFLNPILKDEEWKVNVEFKDEPGLTYLYLYNDNKITQGYLGDGIYDHKEYPDGYNIKIADKYIKEHGYTIFKVLGESGRYKLDKGKLYGKPGSVFYSQQWAVQKVKPDDYFGKEIVLIGFHVKRHPLQKTDSNCKDGVSVCVMIVDGKAIGGTSTPIVQTVGGCYSIDGKTMEQITGLTYKQHSEEWKKRYGS